MFSNTSAPRDGEIGGDQVVDSPTLTASSRPPARSVSVKPSFTSQTGGQPGKIPTISWFMEFEEQIKDCSRFFVQLSDEETTKQIENPGKYLARLNFDPFCPKNEKEYEDWLDMADAQITSKRICPELMLEAWAAAAPVHQRKIIKECIKCSGLEEVSDKIAKKLFGYSEYVCELENDLLQARPQDSVAESIDRLEKIGTRLVRLRQRWGQEVIIPNPHIRKAFLKSLPVHVRNHVSIHSDAITLPQIIDAAVKSEERLFREGAKRATFQKGAEVFAGNPMLDESIHMDENIYPRREQRHRRPIKSHCNICGQDGHLNKDCRYRTARCANCGRIGHISVACKNQVVRDTRGSVRTLIQDKPSETAITTKKDYTTKDRLNAATDVIEGISRLVTDRSNRGKELRAQKATENPGRVRTAIQHPVATACPTDKQTSDPEDEDYPLGLTELFSCEEECYASTTTRSIEKNIAVTAYINGIENQVVIDTGASASLCSEETAWRCGLKPTNVTQRFTGLGPVTATLTEPTEVRIGKRAILVAFYVAPGIGARPLLGVPALRDLNVLVDPVARELKNADPEKYGAPIEVADQYEGEKGISVVPLFDKEESKIDQVVKDLQEKTTHLDSKDVKELEKILRKHERMWNGFKAGRVVSQTATLQVVGNPIRQKLRHLTAESRATLEKHLEEMLKAGVIRPSHSPWASCPVFVKKKGTDRLRLCLDYRQVNERLKADAYPLPLLWDRVQAAAGFKHYVCLDLNTAFWNIPLAEESKPVTALITHKGLFEFNVLPFGIKTCPSMFQRALDSTIGSMESKNVYCYLDDIVIAADDISTILQLTDEVLSLCEKAGFQLRPDKCEWIHPEVKLLGFIISKYGIKPNPQKVETIHAARPPKDKAELRTFLGAIGFMQRFIPDFAELTASLTDLLKKNVRWEWTEEREKAFQLVKHYLSSSTLLNPPRGDGPFVILADASARGIGAALLQMQEGTPVILEFAAKKFSDVQQRWDTRDREGFAIKWAVQQFSPYVRTGQTYLLTDHESLTWMNASAVGRVQRWLLYLSQFDLKVFHFPGKLNLLADWLSRSLPEDEGEAVELDEIAVPDLNLINRNDGNSSHKSIYAPYVPTLEEFVKANLTATAEELRATTLGENNLRFSVKTRKLFVPQSLRESILFWFHNTPYGGHCGVNRTVRRMKNWVWWSGMKGDVANYVQQCLICVRRGLRISKTLRGLLTRPTAFQLVSLDYVGPRTFGQEQWSYLVIIDHATRFLFAAATERISADHASGILTCTWVPIFGAPEAILTDRGTTFTSPAFSEMVTKRLGAYHIFTSPYFPQGNAVNEASHQSLERSLSAAAAMGLTNFPEALQNAAGSYNATPHPATGNSPHWALYGREPVFPGWQALAYDVPEEIRTSNRSIETQIKMTFASAQSHYKKIFPTEKVEEGDWIVFLRSTYESKTAADTENVGSYAPPWSLPAKVIRVGKNQITVKECGSGRERQVPTSQARLLKGEIPPSLQKTNLREIFKMPPRRPEPPGAAKDVRADMPPVTWRHFMSEAPLNIYQRSRPPE